MPDINENDQKLLGFCQYSERSVGEIAQALDIAPKNVSLRLPKLEKLGLITIHRKGQGKKTYVRTTGSDKTKEYYLELLREIERRGGEISQAEYTSLLPFSFKRIEDKDKFHAPLKLLFTDLVEKRVAITEEGKKFLKEYSKRS